MEKLEQSREALKNALIRLEKVIEAGFTQMKMENQALEHELLKYKVSSRKRITKGVTATGSTEDNLVNASVSNEIDLSLKELKKLVG